MIDKRELLAKARERHLNLNIMEKDYVLGWVLFGFSQIDSLVFKGRTALSEIYFPEIWHLSEDLDFSLIEDDFPMLSERTEEIFGLIEKKSGIKLDLKSKFSNPEYLQLKIKYDAVIGRNWIRLDMMKNDLVEKPSLKFIKKLFLTIQSLKLKLKLWRKFSAQR